MAATRATLTAVPTTRPRRQEADAPRPDLRVVPPRRATGAIVAVALVLVFGVLLATAALNTMLVSGQRNLDRLETDIREGQQRNQALALQEAEMESPERIKEAAVADGMVEPDEVTWVAPRADGTSDAVTEPTAAADAEGDGAPTDDAQTDDAQTDDAQTDDGQVAGTADGEGSGVDERADGGPDGSDG